jgi:putative flippase GtrA
MVFKSSPTAKNAAGYFSLAVAVMALGSAGVTGLTALGLGSVLSKIIVDCTLYVCNYIIQKKYIFKK